MTKVTTKSRRWSGHTHQREGVLGVEMSANAKIGPCSATYVAKASCPPDCAFYDSGCYGDYGPTSILWRRVSASFDDTLEVLAANEAAVIDEMSARFDLRLHIVGDSPTERGTRVLADAVRRYRRAHDRAVWAYTHAWRNVSRRAWGDTSILASCESLDDVKRAHRRGYAAAIVVPAFERKAAYSLAGSKVQVIPCPAETRGAEKGITCASCRLCFDDGRLKDRRLVIGFTPHGSGATRVRSALSLPVVR